MSEAKHTPAIVGRVGFAETGWRASPRALRSRPYRALIRRAGDFLVCFALVMLAVLA